MSESEKEEKIKRTVAGPSEKMYDFAGTPKASYEKILSEDTAQVGVIFKNRIPGVPSTTPFNEAILKKENGVWKFYAYRSELIYHTTEEQLLEDIKNNPSDTSLYYYLGEKYRAKERYVKLKECFKKYYELEPKGFWVGDSLLREVNEDYGEIEKELLGSFKNLPKTAHRAKASNYRKLGYFYMDTNQHEKALEYLKKSLELDSKQLGAADDVREAIKEIEALMSKSQSQESSGP